MGLDPKHRSRALTEGFERAPARAYLKGIGYDDDALARPLVAVANTWIETMPCNFHLRVLAARARRWKLQGMVSIHVLATATSGRARASSS